MRRKISRFYSGVTFTLVLVAFLNSKSGFFSNSRSVENVQVKFQEKGGTLSRNNATKDLSVTPATITDLQNWENVLLLQTGTCEKIAEVGGRWYCQAFDGEKDVCFDEWLIPDFNSCVMYSFGVGTEITFEKAMVEAWGCDIYLHDPFVNHTKEFYSFSKKIHFKPVGISLESHKDENNIEFLSYKDALRMNGHNADTDIHYLKIDVEESEFKFLSDLIESGILKNVWQLHMEVHSFNIGKNWLGNMKSHHQVLKKLEDIGFRRVSSSVHNLIKLNDVQNDVPVCCIDTLWVNLKRR